MITREDILSRYEEYLETRDTGRNKRRLTGEQIRRIKKRWNDRGWNSCMFCGSTDQITIEHIIPLFLGGAKTEPNAVPACYSCNEKRNNEIWRIIHEG